jgi:uncharacterized delta-60 repeat protein
MHPRYHAPKPTGELMPGYSIAGAKARLRRQRRSLLPIAEDLEGRTLLSVGLDQNYGLGGMAELPAPPNTSTTNYDQSVDSIALQNGQVVAVGTLDTVPVTGTSSTSLNVWRLTTAGTLDTTFGTSGTQTIPLTIGGTTFTPDTDFRPQIAVQSNGSIDVVAAVSSTTSSGDELMVAQLTPTGAVDTTFGTAGVELLSIPTGYSLSNADNDTLSVAIGPGGTIAVAAGLFSTSIGDDVFGVFEFNANGTPDTSFGTSGFATAAFNNGTSTPSDDDPFGGVAVLPNSDVVVAGNFSVPQSSSVHLTATPSDTAVAMFNANGTLDTAFNGTGLLSFNYNLGGSASEDSAGGVTLDGSEIAIAGSSTEVFTVPTGNTLTPDIGAATVAMLNTNGTFDTAFNGTGKYMLSPTQGGITFNASATAITTLADGSLLIGGSASEQNSSASSNTMLANLTTAGTLNTTYGTGGVALLPGQGVSSQLLVQTDGKVVFIPDSPGNDVARTTAPTPVIASTSITTTGTGRRVAATAVTITFNTAVNPTLASNIKIYVLKGGKARRAIKIKHVSLDSTGENLSFTFARTPISKGFAVVITPGAIVAADGEVLNNGAPITITIAPTATTASVTKARR